MEGEVKSAEKVMHDAEKPFLAIIGGAKVSDKILILENLLERADDIIIGGEWHIYFYKAQGGQIGNSLRNRKARCRHCPAGKGRERKGVCIHLPADSL